MSFKGKWSCAARLAESRAVRCCARQRTGINLMLSTLEPASAADAATLHLAIRRAEHGAGSGAAAGSTRAARRCWDAAEIVVAVGAANGLPPAWAGVVAVSCGRPDPELPRREWAASEPIELGYAATRGVATAAAVSATEPCRKLRDRSLQTRPYICDVLEPKKQTCGALGAAVRPSGTAGLCEGG